MSLSNGFLPEANIPPLLKKHLLPSDKGVSDTTAVETM